MAITSNYTLQWILPFVRESLSKREPYKEFDFPVYVEGLWTIFERVHVEGIVRKPVGAGYDATSFLVRQSPEMIRSLAIEAFNYLLSNGLLARTVTDTNIDGLRGQFPYFLTKRGADWASSKELMPEDSAQYMKLVITKNDRLETNAARPMDFAPAPLPICLPRRTGTRAAA